MVRCMFRGTLASRWSFVGWLALAVAGCAVVTPETQISTTRTRFDTALLSYRVEQAAAGQDAPVASKLAARPSSRRPQTQLLQIQYPHPAGRAGFARVELVLGAAVATPEKSLAATLRRALNETAPGISYAEGIAEAWGFDLPAVELDRLLEQLEAAGYFSPGDSGDSHVSLTARIDGNDFQRAWHRSPELDALCVRARKDGKLVSHQQPLEPAPVLAGSATPDTPPASTPWRPGAVIQAQALEPAYEITRLPPVDPASDNSGAR